MHRGSTNRPILGPPAPRVVSARRFGILATAMLLLAGAALAAPRSSGTEEGEGSARTWIPAMAQEHEGDTSLPSGAAFAPRRPVTTESVQYENGVRGYLARPQDVEEPLPGLIVIHEWWGLNENIQAMTERLAGEGYFALAVDLFGGEVAQGREDALRLMGEAMAAPGAATANLRSAYDFLVGTQGATRVGTIGWGFGGAWSLVSAIALGDELDAAVVYYGRLITDKTELEKIEAPVLGLFGKADQGIPVSSVKAFQRAMKELGKTVEVKIYDHADHAFANPSGSRYDAEAAADAWKRTTGFLHETLRGDGAAEAQ